MATTNLFGVSILGRKVDFAKESVYNTFKPSPPMNKLYRLRLMYKYMLEELACNRFKWIGLPESVDERYVELCLLYGGLLVFYYDMRYSRYLAVQATGIGSINVFDNPTQFQTVGNRIISVRLGPDECVPIWPNRLRQPQHIMIDMYSERLADVEVSLDQAIINSRNPIIVGTSAENKLSFENALKRIRDGDAAILATQSFAESLRDSVQGFPMINTNHDDMILKLHQAKCLIWNDCMTFLGYRNADTKKSERMITSEVESNDEQVIAYRNTALNERRRAADQINRMFDLSVSVEWNNDVQEMVSLAGTADSMVTR